MKTYRIQKMHTRRAYRVYYMYGGRMISEGVFNTKKAADRFMSILGAAASEEAAERAEAAVHGFTGMYS